MPDSNKLPETNRQILGTTETALGQIKHVNGAWQFQLLGNVDVLMDHLEKLLPAEQMATVRTMAEEAVKRQLRRQVGRLRAIERLLQEIVTIASKE